MFDFFIVLISLLAMYFPDLPALSVLRLFRAFRVVRLFKRVDEMKKIIEGIMKSLPALSYAFVAMGLIMGIWAIMGVDFFADIASPNTDGEIITGYFFGSFFRAFLSLGQITSFDSWSSGIARDIIYVEGAGAALYFITFIFISGIIMMNVLVALLLDNYLQPSTSRRENEGILPEEAMDQLTTYIQDSEIDLMQFLQYLNNEALPDFIEHHHQPACSSKQEKIDLDYMQSASLEVMEQASKTPGITYDVQNVASSIGRIGGLLRSLEESNDELAVRLAGDQYGNHC